MNNTTRADSRFAPSQWEAALLCNDVSHWLGANLESALYYVNRYCITTITQRIEEILMYLLLVESFYQRNNTICHGNLSLHSALRYPTQLTVRVGKPYSLLAPCEGNPTVPDGFSCGTSPIMHSFDGFFEQAFEQRVQLMAVSLAMMLLWRQWNNLI